MNGAKELQGEVWRLSGQDDLMINVHKRGDCVGPPTCVLHNPSFHHMSLWPLRWDAIHSGRKAFYRECRHNRWHPDPDGREFLPGHDCDGCCEEARIAICLEGHCARRVDSNEKLFCNDHVRDRYGVAYIDCDCRWDFAHNDSPLICPAHGKAFSTEMADRQINGWDS